MKLKLDENLSHAAADLFRAAGHEVHTVADEGLSGSPDDEVLSACKREERALVTLDLEFSNPLIFNPADAFGIAVLRLPAKMSHDDLLVVCQTLVQAMARDMLTGKLWSVERGRIREYRPDASS
jgi:predicted nuclease of predicted toxin-antitoxin system